MGRGEQPDPRRVAHDAQRLTCAAAPTASPDPTFATIGEFYRTLAEVLSDLGDSVLTGHPARQVTATRWFTPDRLFPLTDTDRVVRALDLVTEEGEGSATSPVDPDGDVAHFYRFEGIYRGRRLVADSSSSAGYSFTGDPYDFDAAGVWPLTSNQQHDDLDPDTEAWRRVQQFRVTFTRLLSSLQRVVDGHPEDLDAAMGVMFELKIAGQKLAANPIVEGAVAIGPHPGPVFLPVLANRRSARDRQTGASSPPTARAAPPPTR